LKRFGSISILLAICLAITGLVLRYVGYGDAADMIAMAFVVAILSGLLFSAIAGVLSLRAGRTRLRPAAALRAAPLVFAGALALRLLIEMISAEPGYDWAGMLLFSAVFATIYCLYSTAYRRTA